MVRRNDSPKDRRKALARKLRESKLDLAVISNPKHIFYFTGFPSNLNMYLTLMKGPRSTSFLAIRSDGESSILLGNGELSNPWIKESSPRQKSLLEKTFNGEVTTYVDYDRNDRIVVYGDYLSLEFSNWIKKLARPGETVAIEDWHLADVYRSMISRVTMPSKLVGISSLILSLRKIKGRDEEKNLRAATKMLDLAYGFAKKASKSGRSEVDVYREVNYRTFKEYGPFGWIIGDHISGERSLGVGGWPTGRVMRRGDTLILDLQAAYDNYWSDLCRTFVAGGPTREQSSVQRTLVKSLHKAEEIMKPGVSGKEIYTAVNAVVTGAGHPDIPHHVGHSIGLDDQEPPWFIPSSEEELEEGMVCVVEPGIYAKPTGGIRLEDAFVITRNGCERISHFPLTL